MQHSSNTSSRKICSQVTPQTFNSFFGRYRDAADGEFYQRFPVTNGLFFCEGPIRTKGQVERLWIVDADDTLWEDNLHYEEIISEVISYALENGVPLSAQEMRRLIDETEHRTIAQVGFGVEGFRRSMREAWGTIRQKYLPHVPDPNPIFDKIIPFLSGVPYHIPPDTFSFLHGVRANETERLILFTQGPLKTQLGKIANSGLAPLFDGIAVGDHKRIEAYEELLIRSSARATECVVVGNSLNSEVKPALALGLRAFHLNNPNSWHSVNTDNLDMQKYVTVNSLTEILALMRTLA